MIDKTDRDAAPISKKKLLTYFGLAYLGAAALLIAAVLPAEYGIDPLGIGKITGINKLNAQKTLNAENVLSSRDEITEGIGFAQDKPFKTETLRIDLEDIGELEHKLIMKKGETIVFSWEVEGETPNKGVYFDFHGHPPTANTKFPQGFAQSFIKGERPSGHGSLTAPFDGYFGWYFLNIEERAITINIEVSGYWDKDIELYRAVNGEVTNKVDY